MSCPFLPPELLDLIVDHLHDQPISLKSCCLVSKSWIPRARRNLFARIEFNSYSSSIESWRNAFPDPSLSPTHYTRVLEIIGLPTVGAAGAREFPWIHSFRRIVTLFVGTIGWSDDRLSLVHFRGLSPTLRSLSLYCASAPLPEIFGLICSFPLLEDLALHHEDPKCDLVGWTIPSTSPKLTGSLKLGGQNLSIIRGLLCLPGGLHFSKILVSRPVGDVESIMDLASRCRNTLESLRVKLFLHTVNSKMPSPLDLSRAPKLRDVGFEVGPLDIQWVVVTLKATKPKLLRQITIHSNGVSPEPTPEAVRGWRDLDHLLAGLWTSHSILPKISRRDCLQALAPSLLPELTSKGFKPEFGYEW